MRQRHGTLSKNHAGLDEFSGADGLSNGQALPSTGGSMGSSSHMSPGIAAPNGASMGSTAQAGGFGLNGVQAMGGPVAGQSSPTPDRASLAGQPLTVNGSAPAQTTSPYGNLASALGAIKQQQQQGPKSGVTAAPKDHSHPISLQQAKAMFDPSRFYTMLQAQGLTAQRGLRSAGGSGSSAG